LIKQRCPLCRAPSKEKLTPVDSLQKQEKRAAGAVTVEVKNPSPAEHEADDNADVDPKLEKDLSDKSAGRPGI